jgi:mitogen-activated protein kinase kinase kinase 5
MFSMYYSVSTCELEENGPLMNRRNSSGTLLSPEVESPRGAEAEQDGFYLLKKDSQRRTTLTRVLTQDESKICSVWMKSIQNDVEEPVLTMVSYLCVFLLYFYWCWVHY